MSDNDTKSAADIAPRLQNIAVPDDLHRLLKLAACQHGMTLRQFVLPALQELAAGAATGNALKP
jgi:hypothetical protein